MTEGTKKGRPSSFTQEIADALCEAIVESDYGLEEVCNSDERFPSARTVFRWLAAEENDAFRQQYARAKVEQSHIQAGRGVRDALQAKDASLGRLAFDARKWHAAKLNMKEYGDKQAITGPDGTGPVQVERIERVIIDPPK